MINRKFLIIAILIFTLGVNTSRIVLAESKEDIPVSQVTRLSPIAIYDEGNLLKLSIEDIGKYHGDVCACVVASFRATQLVISELWEDEIPKREDFKIISAHPSRGSQDAFEFITRAKTRGDFTLRLPKGTDIKNLSKDNWTFTFIRKSTGEQIRIQVKEKIFPQGSKKFFTLRKKALFKNTPTEDEKEMFMLAKQKLKNAFMNLPLDRLFNYKKQ